MKYFRLNPNVTSKKWKGTINLGDLLIDGAEVDEFEFAEAGAFQSLPSMSYELLEQGEFSPVNTIGSSFFVFDDSIPDVGKLSVPGVQLIPLKYENSEKCYLLMHVHEIIDCVDWVRSEYEPWTQDHDVKAWQNPRGRFFFEPVLIDNKIPRELEAFRLGEWGGAFNIVITERLKERIRELEFDHSFLEFHELSNH